MQRISALSRHRVPHATRQAPNRQPRQESNRPPALPKEKAPPTSASPRRALSSSCTIRRPCSLLVAQALRKPLHFRVSSFFLTREPTTRRQHKVRAHARWKARPSDSRAKKKKKKKKVIGEALFLARGGGMSGKRDKEGKKEGKRGCVETAREVATAEAEKVLEPAQGTRQTRVTWLCLGEEWGVVRDVRMMIYKLLTPLERVTVERAHGVSEAFERHKTTLCRLAAKRGHLKVLQWARANGCHWDAYTCSLQQERGHLAVLQWARGNGCSWDAYTCSYAARGGRLEVLQWARANGCLWDEWTCSYAAQRRTFGSVEMGPREWMSMECSYLCGCGRKRTFRNTAVGSRKWVSLG